MIKISRLFLFFVVFTTGLVACNTQRGKFEFIYPESGQTLSKGQRIELRLKFPESAVDSVVYSVDGNVIARKTDTSALLFDTNEFNFGNRSLSAKLYSEGKESIAYSSVVIVPQPPKQYGFEIINTFPHDTLAYTQGLQYDGRFLYESTGQWGRSSLRKVDLQTGNVLQKIDIDKEHFGEGLTIIGNKIVLLTWTSELGFVYDKDSFKLLQTFKYPKGRQGWGIVYDGKRLIQSDGSSFLYFLDPNTFQEIGTIQVFDNNGPVDKLNEMEYINGKIYTNLYYSDRDEAVIIDPETGVVEGRINFIGMYDGKRSSTDNEMNGIAYNESTGNLYVTGKDWSKLFEVRLVER